MRCLWLLFLFACAVRAEDHAEFLKLIHEHWGKDGAVRVEVTLPAEIPAIPDGAVLSAEFTSGGSFGHRSSLMRWEPAADGNTRVRQIRDRVNVDAASPREFGVTATVGSMTEAQYAALLGDLLLIHAAKFRWRDTKERRSGRILFARPFYTRTRIGLGSRQLVHELMSAESDPWDLERACLYADRISQAVQMCTFKQQPIAPVEAARLLDELIAERATESRWGSAIALRVEVLGAIGYAPAAAELRRIEKGEKGNYTHSMAQKSLRQIDLLTAADPKARVLVALDEPSNEASAWTRGLARHVYRDDYQRYLRARVKGGDRRALLTLRKMAEDTSELKRLGLTLSDAGKRASAAATAWEITGDQKYLAELIAIARDKALVSADEYPVRGESIALLQRIAPGEKRVRNALLMLVVDVTDDARIRDRAARALRDFGDARTVAVLRAQQASSPSPAIAETLRVIEAK